METSKPTSEQKWWPHHYAPGCPCPECQATYQAIKVHHKPRCPICGGLNCSSDHSRY